MIRFLVLLACLAAASSAQARKVTSDPANRTVTKDMRALPVHIGGRVRTDPLFGPMPGGARSYVHNWPGVYFEAGFEGDSVTLKFDDEANEYRLLIDDQPPIPLPQPGKAEVTVSNLARAPHRLRLEKMTEGLGFPRAFQGFYVPKGETPLKPAARARQIEFIGDSSMTGFGARSPTTSCDDDQARLTSDAPDAYPALVAGHFDADYQLNAISGHGLIRNYGGGPTDHVLPAVYPYVILNKTTEYLDPRWTPEIIVIKLNADFVSPLLPTEKWKNQDELLTDYAAGYGKFVASLHWRYPRAAFLIWWFDTAAMGIGPAIRVDTARKTIADAAARAGVKSIDFLPMKDLGYDRLACGGHPSLADHRKTADWLIAYLNERPQLWQGK